MFALMPIDLSCSTACRSLQSPFVLELQISLQSRSQQPSPPINHQVTAAVHAKLLRLNSASVASISAGQVINLVSNDARRFDDYSPHVPWIILAPIELGMVRRLRIVWEIGNTEVTLNRGEFELIAVSIKTMNIINGHDEDNGRARQYLALFVFPTLPDSPHGVPQAGNCPCNCWREHHPSGHAHPGKCRASNYTHSLQLSS